MADTSKSKVSSTTLMFEEEVVERRLAFKPDPELGNLCMGMINDVRIDIREVPLLDDKGVESTWEYAGCKFPVLVIEFKQCKTDANPKDRYYTFTAKPVTTLNKKANLLKRRLLLTLFSRYMDSFVISQISLRVLKVIRLMLVNVRDSIMLLLQRFVVNSILLSLNISNISSLVMMRKILFIRM